MRSSVQEKKTPTRFLQKERRHPETLFVHNNLIHISKKDPNTTRKTRGDNNSDKEWENTGRLVGSGYPKRRGEVTVTKRSRPMTSRRKKKRCSRQHGNKTSFTLPLLLRVW